MVFAVLGNRLYVTKDDGWNWTSLDSGLPDDRSAFEALAADDDYLFVSSGATLWRRPLSGLMSIESRSGYRASEFMLEQNYPNPFNPATSVSYTLPMRSFVSIDVFNVLGERVATLVEGVQEAGTHLIEWNGTSLPSGVYICRLRAGPQSAAIKMLLLR
jgi:hypothetical protein